MLEVCRGGKGRGLKEMIHHIVSARRYLYSSPCEKAPCNVPQLTHEKVFNGLAQSHLPVSHKTKINHIASLYPSSISSM